MTSYDSPLATRYASREMLALFSDRERATIWRQLWVALAEAECELGLSVTHEQVEELRAAVDKVDLNAVHAYERELRHDVMAHIHAFGDQCPKAKGILHLGATSCYVTDNGDLLQMGRALDFLIPLTVQLIRQLADLAKRYRKTPCLAYTHLQPAQPTTLGKRLCLWLQDLLIDLEELVRRRRGLKFLGAKGTTGTQASFLTLFDGDHEKVKQLDRRIAELMGFDSLLIISGQTYSRKQDQLVIDALAGLAVTAQKMATDLRLLAHLKEVEEPLSERQIGSSAMPHKRNPMAAERVCGLSRFVIALSDSARQTAATQWLERTLDDSSNRRLVLPQAFLAVDAILHLLLKITADPSVYPKMMERHLREELPFLAMERLLMLAVQQGGNRQDLHERMRVHSQLAAKMMKEEGMDNDLLERIAADSAFGFTNVNPESVLKIEEFIGRAPEQVDQFLDEEIAPLLQRYSHLEQPTVQVRV